MGKFRVLSLRQTGQQLSKAYFFKNLPAAFSNTD